MYDLFQTDENISENLLPYDGDVRYLPIAIEPFMAERYADSLFHTIAWQHDEAIMFGKRIVTKRKVAWYADQPFSYTYSKTTKTALPWTPLLKELKQIVEASTGEHFNACLLNLYHDGSEGMAWHSDGERELVPRAAIASLSFGAERKFSFKHKTTKETFSLNLASGSILIMRGATQSHWLHRLPPTKKVSSPRINLTFRSMRT